MNDQPNNNYTKTERRLLEDARAMRLTELDQRLRLPDGYHLGLGLIEPEGDYELSVVMADRHGETRFDKAIATGTPDDISTVVALLHGLADALHAVQQDKASHHAGPHKTTSTMTLGESVRRAIRGLCAEHDTSLHSLAATLGRSYSGFNERMSHNRLTMADIDAAADALGIEFWDIFERAELIAGDAFIAKYDDMKDGE